LTVLFAITTAVALSQWIGVFGWGWPNSSRVNRKIMPSLQFRRVHQVLLPLLKRRQNAGWHIM